MEGKRKERRDRPNCLFIFPWMATVMPFLTLFYYTRSVYGMLYTAWRWERWGRGCEKCQQSISNIAASIAVLALVSMLALIFITVCNIIESRFMALNRRLL